MESKEAFLYTGHSQGHKIIELGITWKGFIISSVCTMHATYDFSIFYGTKIIANDGIFLAIDKRTNKQVKI